MSDTNQNIDIDYVAKLSRIELTDAEKKMYSSQLNDIIEYFKKIDAVNVDGVEPLAHAFPSFNVWDEDEVEPGLTAEESLANAPAKRDNQIIVPKVVE